MTSMDIKDIVTVCLQQPILLLSRECDIWATLLLCAEFA